jgi:hypothetical protein
MSASNQLQSKCGTPVYMGALPSTSHMFCVETLGRQSLKIVCAAPEMLQNRPYNESVDVWAAGIILYIM